MKFLYSFHVSLHVQRLISCQVQMQDHYSNLFCLSVQLFICSFNSAIICLSVFSSANLQYITVSCLSLCSLSNVLRTNKEIILFYLQQHTLHKKPISPSMYCTLQVILMLNIFFQKCQTCRNEDHYVQNGHVNWNSNTEQTDSYSR